MYTGNIVKDIYSGKLNHQQLGQLKRQLSKTNPKLWADIQQNSLDHLKAAMTKDDGFITNVTNMRTHVRENARKLKSIHGEEYVKDVNKLLDVAEMVSMGKFARGASQTAQPALLQLTRSLIGPLSKPQRFLTAITRIGKKKGNDALLQILSDPRQLEKYIRLGELDPTKAAAGGIIMDFVGNGILDLADIEQNVPVYLEGIQNYELMLQQEQVSRGLQQGF